jgi:nucleoside triphosphate diphosphatase
MPERPLPRPESDALVQDPAGGLPRLLEIMARLRDPATGCPWDIEQTFATIAPYTIEEAHEVADAIARSAWDDLPGELGDLLLQVVRARSSSTPTPDRTTPWPSCWPLPARA